MMAQLNLIPRAERSNKYLIPIVIWISSLMIQPVFIQDSYFTLSQTSVTTWELLNSDFPDAVFRDVLFINSTHGWIVGRAMEGLSSNAIVLHTKNGGDSWQVQYNRDEQRVTNVDVIDDQTIWINGYGSLFYSLDGGSTWNESSVTGGIAALSAVKFINMTHGFTSNNGVLYKTRDGGVSWEEDTEYSFDDTFRMIQCLSSNDIWAIGFAGIYHSIDGGETWANTSSRGGWAVSIVSATEGWAISDSRLAHMTDGESWEELIVPMRAPLYRLQAPYCTDILFIDEDNGWIGGTEVPVMYTPDGGINWFEQSVPVEGISRINAVNFINESHGWAVGWNGVIMRTTSGNSIGNRLWYGMTDPLFLSIIFTGIAASVGALLLRRYWRGKRTDLETKSYSPEIK